MKKLWNKIGQVVVDILGWIAVAVIMLALLGLLLAFGTVALGAIAALVVLAVVVGGIRKLFGVKKKDTIRVKATDKPKRRTIKYGG